MSMKTVPIGAALAVAVTGFLIGVIFTEMLVARQTIQSGGQLETAGVCVFWEETCTNNVSSIDWGSLEVGATKEATVYISNDGGTPVTLNMTTDNWSPALASYYIELSWNREDYVLKSGSVAKTVLTLAVARNVQGFTEFNFDIIISGIEASSSI